MSRVDRVFLIPWNDDPQKGRAITQALYPGSGIIVLDKRSFRESSFTKQIRTLRGFRGKALVLSVRSLSDLNTPILLPWIGLLHRCPVTVVIDDDGNKQIYGRWSWVRSIPNAAFAVTFDACVLFLSLLWVRIALWRGSAPIATDAA